MGSPSGRRNPRGGVSTPPGDVPPFSHVQANASPGSVTHPSERRRGLGWAIRRARLGLRWLGDGFGVVGLLFVGLVGLGRLTGYVEQALIAYFFGVGASVDAFVAANALPDLLGAILVTGLLGYAIIPTVTGLNKAGDSDAANRVVGNALSLVVTVCTVVVIAAIYFAPFLIDISAPGLHGDVRRLAIQLFRACAPSLLFFGLSSLGSGVLNMRKSFLPAPISLAIGNAVGIMILFSSPIIGIQAAAWGYTLSTVAMALVQWAFVYASGVRVRFQMSPTTMKLLVSTVSAASLVASSQYLRVFGERVIASSLPAGDLAALNFAVRLMSVITSMAVMPVATMAFPTMAAEAVDGGQTRILWRGIAIAEAVSIPACICLLLFSRPIVDITLGRGAFGAGASDVTASILMWYGPYLPPYAANELLVRSFLARSRSLVAVGGAIFAPALSIAIDVALLPRYGVVALPMGAAIGALTSTALLVWMHFAKRPCRLAAS